jgi:hypothetical protein
MVHVRTPIVASMSELRSLNGVSESTLRFTLFAHDISDRYSIASIASSVTKPHEQPAS